MEGQESAARAPDTQRGRLIKASAYRGDPHAFVYVVAVPNAADAIALVRAELDHPSFEFEDLGPVAEALLAALSLEAGQVVRL
jgi:hypothetical protein